MNKVLSGSLFFITGAAIASFITYKMVEKKFKDIADEEIASVKEMYERKINNLETKSDVTEQISVEEIAEFEVPADCPPPICNKLDCPQGPQGNPYASLISDLGYGKNEKEEKEEKETMAVNDNINVIPPEDFGEYGYKCESLTYYADKVLTFDNDEKITDVNKYVGPDALNTFGEYEDDSVFVRNHRMKTDFEILLDSRRYLDVVGDTENVE